jgi:uncharacterized membrane protein
MTQSSKYHGTTVTDFVARYWRLLVVLAFFLGLTLLAFGHTATLVGRAIGLFSFCALALVWLALLFQCMRARPLTALMELLALALIAGFIAVTAAWLISWWPLRTVTLSVVFYMTLFLGLDETGISRRPVFANGRARRIGLRLLCLLAALLFAYMLRTR